MKRISLYSLIFSASILISSCNVFNYSSLFSSNGKNDDNNINGSTSKKKNKNNNKNDESDTENMLFSVSDISINGKWDIIDVNGNATIGDDRPYIIFEKSTKQIFANNGCNTINANFEITSDNVIKITNILSTQRYCHDAKFEKDINNALANVNKISLSKIGNEYYMNYLDSLGNVLMISRKPNLEFLNGTWKITKINGNSNKLRHKNYELALDIAELKLHGNVGCNIVNGSILLDTDKKNSIMFLDLISTKMTCPDGELETEILIALEKVENYSKKESNKQIIILYDKDGKEVIELTNTTSNYLPIN